MSKKSSLKVVTDKNDKGNKKTNRPFSVEELKTFYKEMLTIRRFEEKAAQMYSAGLMGGFCHLYIGQEAVVTGIKAASKPENDYSITSYRCHAHAISCGVDPKQVMAELTGRSGGISTGKGGSMHMFDPEKGFFGGHGIVAAQIPLGTGLAFAAKYRGEDRVCVAYAGDGAMNGGQVYEAFNMAKLWDLPVLYIVENNRYGMGTSTARASGMNEFYKRGESFGIQGERVDGMDFFAVYYAAKRAMDHIRAGKGPFLLEMETYRYRGHSMSDPAKYRTKEEVEEMRGKHDPITNLAVILQEEYDISQDELKDWDKAIKENVKDAAEFAETSPEPDVSELWTDIVPADKGSK